ncbi:Protein-S-isoprenylcysteine O-methyltransferase Ste14 [Loktanella sp. DSM 29012]|uniref:methyltransferase family protein n=1 Tax=Loktanella sp. DSM 29012 TaxID=1881056 RepID=UPI0008B0E45D|nr:isoprenylcysteine carboxylmethyltransferase family protein [Loktanella sp. DSM 29012]SEP81754.1 Protein-S-isoprenylcysteine O-methyltransferase Ste14 [Loktanella sp. DSM 29012]
MNGITKPANQRKRIRLLRGLALLLVPLVLFTTSAWGDESIMAEVLEPLGALVVIAGVLGRFWAMLYIGGRKNGMVMQDGPYSMCRHPLYLFSTIAATGLGIMLGSIVLAVVIGGLTYVVLMQTAQKEEEFLRAAFPDTYATYAERVPLIVPDLSLFSTPEEVTFFVSNMRTNMADALVFLAFIPLAEAIGGFHEVLGWSALAIY